MTWLTRQSPPSPHLCVFFSFSSPTPQFYSTFCPFSLMNTGLILGLVEGRGRRANEVSAGFQ